MSGLPPGFTLDASPQPSAGKLPPGFTVDPPAAPPPPTPPTPGWFGPAIDLAKNIGTAVEGGLGIVAGTPKAMVGQMNQDVQQYAPNLFTMPPGKLATALAGIQSRQDKLQGSSAYLFPTMDEARKWIVGKTGLDYVPSTGAGRILQKGGEYATAGLLGGPESALLGGLGGVAQQGAKELGLPQGVQNIAGVVTPMLAGGARSASSALMRPTTPAGQMIAAQRVLDETAANPAAPMEAPPIPRAPGTLGQATNDPGILAFEKGRFTTAPNDKIFADIAKGANEATVEHLQAGVGLPSKGQAAQQAQTTSADMHQAVTDALAVAKTTETNAWQAVDPTKSTALDTVPLKRAVRQYVNDLTLARQKFIPKPIIEMIDSLGLKEPLRELQDLRSALTTQARGLKQAGNLNEANAVRGLANVVGNHVDNLTFPDPALNTAYQGARQISAQLHKTFDKKPIERMLADNPSQAARHAMRTPEGFDAYYQATGGAPQAMTAARNHFMAGLTDRAESNAGETQKLLGSGFTGYINDHRFLLNDNRLFTPDQRKVIEDAGKQLDYSARTARTGMSGQSPTANLITQKAYAEALVGKHGAAFANLIHKAKTGAAAGVGELIGSVFHAPGALGGVIGGMVGHATGIPYAKAAESVLGLVDRAIRDPAFAAELRRFRERPNYKTMTPNIQNLFRQSQYPMIMPPKPPKPPRP